MNGGTGPSATALRVDLQRAPRGIDSEHPEFSWVVESEEHDRRIGGYRLQVEDVGGELLWDSGEVADPRPWGVPYAGAPLKSSSGYRWRVLPIDDRGLSGRWSAWAPFETAKLAASEFTASWIALDETPAEDDATVVTFRRDLTLPAEVIRARAYVSACGWYKFFVNGTDLTGASLIPRWTPMDHFVEYQVHDVTAELHAGDNILGMAVGDGRYRGGLSAFDRRRTYGDRLSALVQLEIDLADGTSLRVVTDESWSGGRGAILRSDPMRGERRDLRLPFDDWLDGRMPERFAAVVTVAAPLGRLGSAELPPVTQVDVREPVSLSIAPSGAQIVDFGQNLAGVVRVRLAADAGPEVRITYSELISAAGELETAYMFMDPENPRYFRDEVVLAGAPHEFQPWFSIQGFRYVEIVGAQPLSADDVRAVVLSTDLEYTGEFHCSDARLEQLESNVRWSLRSNFTDTPTDCPTRERAGWTGDIQVFAETSTLFVDAQAYLRRYLRGVAAEQLSDGRIPPYIPSETSVFSGPLLETLDQVSSAVGWGDVAVLTPWDVHLAYGDLAVLERQYVCAQRWLASLEVLAAGPRRRTEGPDVGEHERWIVDQGFHWGEWLRPGEGDEEMEHNWAHGRPVVATAYFAHSSAVLGRIAALLGRDDDAERYAVQAASIRAAWRLAFIAEDGRIGEDHQDDYVRALAFGLLEPCQESAALERLIALIEDAGMHLGTGFLSTKMLLPVLTSHGRSDIAYAILMQESEPGWLSQLARGATTICERWDGFFPDGSPRASHNHYAFGAVASWLYHGVAGLSAAEPGWASMRVDPQIGGGVTSASARVATPYGAASSAWELDSGVVTLEVEVPFSTTAVIVLPEGERVVGSGTHAFRYALSA